METQERASIFWEEDGFSTVGMVLALLITLALLFTCAQVYEINTASAQVQETADAAVLAAENMVGEFYIVVTVCDTLSFTLSLAMVVTLGIGVVCACIPATASISKTMIDASSKLRKARDSFYNAATEGLEKLQRALPFIAEVKAQEVLAANSVNGASYQGLVVLLPWQGEDDSDGSYTEGDGALSETEQNQEDLRAAAEQAEEAAKRADEWKQKGYEHDSGSKDSYCMYERAAKLTSMSASENPFFSSVDTWSFADALKRAQIYYRYRCQTESPASGSVAEVSNSVLRKHFYEYALNQVNRGYVHETEDSFDALFPKLPRNTAEMKGTTLYTDVAYPVTVTSSGKRCMHAWSGCPQIARESSAGMGSIKQMVDGGYAKCETCRFTASSMGNVANASTVIENGFEYHYAAVAEAAEEYEKARAEADALARAVKEKAGGLLDKISDALAEVAAKRIEMYPPGYLGAVALVVDTGTAQSRFSSSFVASGGAAELGTRAAVSSATLVKESSDEGENVLTSFLDGVTAEGSVVAAPLQGVLDVWSALLGVYAQGQEALISGVQNLLDGIPLASHSGLGTWAAGVLTDAVEGVGYSAPDLSARKAVLVNSGYVMEADGSAISARLLSVKRTAASSGGSLDGVLTAVESSALSAVEELGSGFTVATLTLFDGAIEIPLTLALPEPVTSSLAGALQSGIDSLRWVVSSMTGVRQWR